MFCFYFHDEILREYPSVDTVWILTREHHTVELFNILELSGHLPTSRDWCRRASTTNTQPQCRDCCAFGHKLHQGQTLKVIVMPDIGRKRYFNSTPLR
ncbi:hypothetical protein AVEN_213454-1 [Araneus ventricosus]|uniref:Uncharacterized protein n=1 Tax=Araneus ventricosus TaxID=182803 RepID=A0A4Y2L6D0_ARAVE|nr:hypothetical protein AVEN_213454-1 [Araneus ventricosus]